LKSSSDTNKALLHLNLADQQLTGSTEDGGKSLAQGPIKLLENIANQKQRQTQLAPYTSVIGTSLLPSKNTTLLPRGAVNKTEATTTQEAVDFLQYINPTTDARIQYPSAWKVIEEGGGSVRFLAPLLENDTESGYQESLYLTSRPSNNLTVDESINKFINSSKYDTNNFQVIKSNPNAVVNTTLDGNPARKIIFTYNDGTREIKAMEVVTIKGDKEYDVFYQALPIRYDYYLPIIQKMIDSYKLEFFQYENPSSGVSMQYPSDWEIDERFGAEGVRHVKFTSPQIGTEKFQEYLNVEVYPNFHNNSPNNIPSGDESRIGFKLLESSDATTLNGNPSHRMVYTFRNGYDEYKAMQVVTIKGDKVYKFDFYAEVAKYSNYLPIIQKMIDSFKIIDFVVYENPASGVTIEYPTYWKKQQTDRNVTFFSPLSGYSDSYQENLFLSVDPSYKMTINETVASDIDNAKKSYSDFKLLTESSKVNSPIVNTTLEGNTNQTGEIAYKYTDKQQHKFIVKQIFAIENDKVYRIRYTAEVAKYSNYLPIIQKMIDSFKIIDLLPLEKVNLKTYENSTSGIRMQYPHEWISSDQIKNKNKGEISFWPRSENNTLSQVRIGSYRILGETLDEIVSDNINSNRQNLTSFQLTESSSTTLAGNSSAYKVIFTFTDSGVYYKEMGIYMIKGNKLFLLSYIEEPGRFSSYLPTVQKMADSLRIQIPDNNINQSNKLGVIVANSPTGISVDPDTNILYVANAGSNTVSVVDGRTNSIVTNITVGDNPNSLSIDLKAHEVYVANSASNTVSVIDTLTNKITANISVGTTPVDIAIDRDRQLIFVANRDSNTISVIDGGTEKVLAKIPVGRLPMGLAIDPFTSVLYVANAGSNTVSVIDYMLAESVSFKSNLIANVSMSVGNYPNDVAVNPTTNKIYVANQGASNTVSVIDGNTNAVVSNIPVGMSPYRLAVNAHTNTIYLDNEGDNTVSVINGKTNSVIKTIPIGNNPNAMDIDLNTRLLYVTNTGSGTVSVINGDTNNVTVGVLFKINPSDSTHINCNGKELSNNAYVVYDADTVVKCNTNGNNGFTFISWSGSLASNFSNNSMTTFKASQFGTVTANFREIANSINVSVPNDLLYGVILGPTVGSITAWMIPFFWDRHNRKTNLQDLRTHIPKIDQIYESHKQNKEECLHLLTEKRIDITKLLEYGKMDDSTFQILNDRISQYFDELNNGDRDSDINTESVSLNPNTSTQKHHLSVT
jgi:YVTN family beta-propeller protein